MRLNIRSVLHCMFLKNTFVYFVKPRDCLYNTCLFLSPNYLPWCSSNLPAHSLLLQGVSTGQESLHDLSHMLYLKSNKCIAEKSVCVGEGLVSILITSQVIAMIPIWTGTFNRIIRVKQFFTLPKLLTIASILNSNG